MLGTGLTSPRIGGFDFTQFTNNLPNHNGATSLTSASNADQIGSYLNSIISRNNQAQTSNSSNTVNDISQLLLNHKSGAANNTSSIPSLQRLIPQSTDMSNIMNVANLPRLATNNINNSNSSTSTNNNTHDTNINNVSNVPTVDLSKLGGLSQGLGGQFIQLPPQAGGGNSGGQFIQIPGQPYLFYCPNNPTS